MTDNELISLTSMRVNTIENIRKIRPPNTPRSLRACTAEGVDPGELRYLPLSVFELHELNDNPKRQHDFDRRVKLRHDAHIQALHRDMRRCQARYMEQRKVALRKIEISRNNTHRILLQKADSDRKKSADHVDLGKTLTTLGINPTSPPKWLDLDGDGDVSLNELKPLETMMRKMATESKRQERKMKIQLAQELAKVKREEQDEAEREEETKRQAKKELLEVRKRHQRDVDRIEKRKEDEENMMTARLTSERRAKKEFQEEQTVKRTSEKKEKEHMLLRNLRLKEQENERNAQQIKRANERKKDEEKRVRKAEEKWDAIEIADRKRREKAERERREQQREQIQKNRQRRKEMDVVERFDRKKRIVLAKDTKKKFETIATRKNKKQAKKKRKYEEKIEKQADKIENCRNFLQKKQRAKERKLKKKIQHDEQRRLKQHEEVMLELETTKLEKLLKYQHAHLNVRRQRAAKAKRNDWIYWKREERLARLTRLEAQKRGISEHGSRVRKKMELRKETISGIVKEATSDDNWKRAEQLLTRIAQGGDVASPLHKHNMLKKKSGIYSPRKPSKKKEERENDDFISSPRGRGVRLVHQKLDGIKSNNVRSSVGTHSYLGNPHLGDAWDSLHEGELRGKRRGLHLDLVTDCGEVAFNIGTNNPPHIMRMRRARKWLNLSARRFESIFGRVDNTHDKLSEMYRGMTKGV